MVKQFFDPHGEEYTIPVPSDFPDQPDLAREDCAQFEADWSKHVAQAPLAPNYLEMLGVFHTSANTKDLMLPFKYADTLAWNDNVEMLEAAYTAWCEGANEDGMLVVRGGERFPRPLPPTSLPRSYTPSPPTLTTARTCLPCSTRTVNHNHECSSRQRDVPRSVPFVHFQPGSAQKRLQFSSADYGSHTQSNHLQTPHSPATPTVCSRRVSTAP